MSFIRDYFQQARDALLSLPPANRVLAGLLAAVVVIGLGLLVHSSSSGSYHYIFGGKLLGEAEIMKAEGAFSSAGLSDYEVVGSRIRVPAAHKDLYLRALHDGDALPAGIGDIKQQAIEDSSVFESNAHRDARMEHATEQSLARQIMLIPGIRNAQVQYDRAREGLSRAYKQSASVFVVPIGTEPLPRSRIRQIQEHVSAAFAGMNREDVRVTDANGGDVGPLLSEDADPQARWKHFWEDHYERRIARLLSGYGPMRIAAEAVIDPTLRLEKTELQYDAEPSTTRERVASYESESVKPLEGGPPGVASNVGNRPQSLNGAANQSSKISQSTEEFDRLPGHALTHTETGGLLPRRVSVSILLPQSYYTTKYRMAYVRQNPSTDQDNIPPMPADEFERLRKETSDNIKTAVATVLPPLPPGDDRFPLVTVSDYPDLPLESPPVESSTAIALGWLASHWQSVLLVVLALIGLLMVRSFGRTPPSNSVPKEFLETFGLEIPSPPKPEVDPEDVLEGALQMEITGGELKDQLTSMIDKNPDAAANVLRSWIGDAA